MRIAHHFWSRALIAALLLAGCKSNKEQEPATQAAPAPTAPTAPTAPSVTDATLSYLEPSGEGKCRWVQHTPPAEPKTAALLPSDCEGMRLAWSRDGKEGLAYVRNSGEGEAPRAWRVELATGKAATLASPTLGRLGALGFDSAARPVALMEDPREPVGEGDNRQIVFEGKKYPAAMDGQPGLAHAFRLEGNDWKRFETKDSSFEWDLAAGVTALEAYKTLGPTSETLAAAATEALKSVPEDAPVLAELNAVKQTSDETGGWKQLELPGGALYVWETSESELPYLTPPVRTTGAKGLVEPEGLPVGQSNSLSLAARGDLVLVGAGGGESGPQYHLWNARTKKLVTSLTGKSTVTFWPKP